MVTQRWRENSLSFFPWTVVGAQHWLFFLWAVTPKVGRPGRCSTILLPSPPQRREHPSHINGVESNAQHTGRTKVARSFITQPKTSISHSKTLLLVMQKILKCVWLPWDNKCSCCHIHSQQIRLMTCNYYPPGLH